MKCIVRTAMVAALILIGQADTSAQVRSPARVAVTVAIVDELPPEATPSDPAIIIRNMDDGEDLILLRSSSADGDVLTAAVFTLMLARQVQRQLPRGSVQLRVAGSSFPSSWRSERSHAQTFVDSVRTKEASSIPGIGPGRHAKLYLPRNYVVARIGRR